MLVFTWAGRDDVSRMSCHALSGLGRGCTHPRHELGRRADLRQADARWEAGGILAAPGRQAGEVLRQVRRQGSGRVVYQPQQQAALRDLGQQACVAGAVAVQQGSHRRLLQAVVLQEQFQAPCYGTGEGHSCPL